MEEDDEEEEESTSEQEEQTDKSNITSESLNNMSVSVSGTNVFCANCCVTNRVLSERDVLCLEMNEVNEK